MTYQADPAALAFMDYCAVHAAQIFVRENLPGRGWGAYALSELPVDVAIGWVRKWLAEGRTPIRVRESGGSLPADGVDWAQKAREILDAPFAHPPVLNKSGGSDVCPTCIHPSHPGEFCGGRFCACAGGR